MKEGAGQGDQGPGLSAFTGGPLRGFSLWPAPHSFSLAKLTFQKVLHKVSSGSLDTLPHRPCARSLCPN